MAGEGEFPKVDGDVLYASEVNTFHNSIWNNLINTGGNILGIINNSATTWTGTYGTATRRTTDSGVTWATVTTDFSDMNGVLKVCAADKTKSICFDNNAPNCFKAADSGDTWSASSTSPAGSGRINDASFPTATVAVCGGSNLTTRSIYYSTDAGDTWTVCATGETSVCRAIAMLDGSTGFAIFEDKKIWKTTDGGVNWADTGKSVSADASGSTCTIVPLTATTGIYFNPEADPAIETFDTAGAVTPRMYLNSNFTYTYGSNLLKITNGNVYFVNWTFNAEHGNNAALYRSTDSGVTWQVKNLGANSNASLANLKTANSKAQLVEYDTNKLLIMVSPSSLMTLDES